MNYIGHCGNGSLIEGLSGQIFRILLNELIIPLEVQEDAQCLQ
jgi:hypothetical protein